MIWNDKFPVECNAFERNANGPASIYFLLLIDDFGSVARLAIPR